MTITGTIAERNGRVYFLYRSRMTTEPTEQSFYWLLNARPGQLKLGEVNCSDGGSVRAHSAAHFDVDVTLVGGQGAKAEIVENNPIHPPKVRRGIEVRYNGIHQRWEKYSNRHGWVPAEET